MRSITRPDHAPTRSVLAWLDELVAAAEAGARRYGPMRGAIRPAQRPYSILLDRIELEKQAVLEEALA